MKLRYYAETDSLYIELSQRAGADSLEVTEGLVVDLDEHGDVIGIDIEHASEKLDLQTVETVALPAPSPA
ncbi:MAG TPA: DUF2283 domain-containing protein [Chloroflexota bacterium]|jgi:uncharacterized protein YuzE